MTTDPLEIIHRWGSSAPQPDYHTTPKLLKPKAPVVRLTPQMPADGRPTTDTEVRQAIQEAINTVVRWNRLEYSSAKHRSAQTKHELTVFFKKAMYDVWVDNEKRPMMTPEDAISVFLATSLLLLGDLIPDKVKAMETSINKNRPKL